METKTGRGRIYTLEPLPGFQSKEVAHAAAYMDELRERVYDQIVHLPTDALDYEAAGTRLTTGRLGLHLGISELHWMTRLSGLPAQELRESLSAGSLGQFKEVPHSSVPAAEIIELCRRVRDEITLPYLKTVRDFDEIKTKDGATVRGVVTHLQWHWVYHSGHIGLLTFEAGWDYEWKMGGPLAFPAP